MAFQRRWRLALIVIISSLCILVSRLSYDATQIFVDVDDGYYKLSSANGQTQKHETKLFQVAFKTANNSEVDNQPFRRSRDNITEGFLGKQRESFEFEQRLCNEDGSSYGLLGDLHIAPYITLFPHFNASVFEYYVTVDYDVIAVDIWAYADHCKCDTRIEVKENGLKPARVFVGLGGNQVSVLVVDKSLPSLTVVSVYLLHIYRTWPGEHKLPMTNEQLEQMSPCELIQDNDLLFDPKRPIGFHLSTIYKRWSDVNKISTDCKSGDEYGRWIIPCTQCFNRSTCDWSRSVWRPMKCHHKVLTRAQLAQCLANKKIMFVGDSTNRGLMHYVTERVNGSLFHWDKTHDVKVDSSVNNNRTTIGFAYYPQFWKPLTDRPTLEQSVLAIISRMSPVENNKNTVLVIGGVQWLTSAHLHSVHKILQQSRLSEISVIVKGFGAGFHRSKALDSQLALLQQNTHLMAEAKRLGYKRVNSLNMTLARYKDFHQGSCACHFHRIREVLPSLSDFVMTLHSADSLPIMYHVDGDVNAAYSEILIGQMCS